MDEREWIINFPPDLMIRTLVEHPEYHCKYEIFHFLNYVVIDLPFCDFIDFSRVTASGVPFSSGRVSLLTYFCSLMKTWLTEIVGGILPVLRLTNGISTVLRLKTTTYRITPSDAHMQISPQIQSMNL